MTDDARTTGRAKAAPMTAAEVTRCFRPNWQKGCENCGTKPSVPMSGLYGPCHFGTAAALNGAWWDEKSQDLSGVGFD